MKTQTFTIARPDTGAVLPQCIVTVYKADGVTRASLFMSDGLTPQGNPVTADANGSITIAATDGTYILQPVSADGLYSVPAIVVDLYDLPAIQNACAASALAASTSAGLALAAGSSGNPYPNAAATHLPQGVVAINLTSGGSGGSNGTNILATFSGGTLQQNPVIRFDIAGGVVGNVRLVSPGLYIGSGTPTMPSVTFPGAAGSPAITLTAGVLKNPGDVYWVASADSSQILLYGNNAGSVATAPFGGTQVSIYGAAAINAFIAAYPALYETTIPYDGLLVLDAGGRIVGQTPDPALVTLLITAATTAIYETTDTSASGYILDAGGRIAGTLGGGGNFGTEVTAARGNMPSLTARLDSVITPDGAPIINPYRPELLRQARYRLTKLALPTRENILMGISAGGDSWTHDASRWVTPFTDELMAKFGDGGMGFTSFGFPNVGNVAPWIVGNQPSFPNGNARPSRYPIRFYGNISSVYYIGKGPDLAMATFNASGDAIEIDLPSGHPNTVGKLLYVATVGASARVTTNGGSSWTALDLSAGTAGALTTLSITPPAGAATMRIEWVGGTCQMAGVFARGTTGVYVNKIAATGSRADQWAAAPATDWETAQAAIEAHMFIYMDGTNSQSAGVLPSDWGASIATIVTRWRSAIPAIDPLVATPAENQRTDNPVPMPAYAVEGRKQARALRFTFFDVQDLFGDPANPTEYGSSGAIPLFQSDLFHPNAMTGGRSLVSGFLDTVMPFKGV